MVQARNLDRELKSAIALLKDTQKQAVLAMANALAHNDETSGRYKREDDPEFVAELESRWNHYKSGGKMYSAEEVDLKTEVLLSKYWEK